MPVPKLAFLQKLKDALTASLSGNSPTSYDFVIVLGYSGSMGGSRWNEAVNAIKLLAPHVTRVDTNGISLVFFASGSTIQKNIRTGDDVNKMISRYRPGGGTNLTSALRTTFSNLDKSKKTIVLIITDGVPNNSRTVTSTIVNQTKKMNSQDELSVSFIQVGTNSSAASFLNSLTKIVIFS